MRRALVTVLVLVGAALARADHMDGPGGMGGPGGGMGGPPGGPPAFLNKVFSPRLVMEHQQELGLKPAQVEAIKEAMLETQKKLLDLQWQLDAESEALGKLLDADHVDESAVLAKLDRVTEIERQVKKTNFALLDTWGVDVYATVPSIGCADSALGCTDIDGLDERESGGRLNGTVHA